MLLALQEFFDDYSTAINGFHVYYKPDRIAISFSPKTHTQQSYIEHLLENFAAKIKPTLTDQVTLEVTVNNRPTVKKFIVTKNKSYENLNTSTPEFDYMDVQMD